MIRTAEGAPEGPGGPGGPASPLGPGGPAAPGSPFATSGPFPQAARIAVEATTSNARYKLEHPSDTSARTVPADTRIMPTGSFEAPVGLAQKLLATSSPPPWALFLPHLAVSVAAFLCRREPTMRFSADQRRALAMLSTAGRDGLAQSSSQRRWLRRKHDRWSRQSWVGDAHDSKGVQASGKVIAGGHRNHHGNGSRRRRLRIGCSHRVRVPSNSAEATHRRRGHCSPAQQ